MLDRVTAAWSCDHIFVSTRINGDDMKKKPSRRAQVIRITYTQDALARIGHELEKRYAAGEPRLDIEEYCRQREELIKQTRARGR
jgi:hypothetical protein